MSNDDLVFATATELAQTLRARKISSVELTKYFLGRLEKIGPRYNALAELTADLAMQQAQRADRELHKGRPSWPPLHGIPYGAKDLLATKNIPTRWGAPPFKNQVFDYDATAIVKMRETGAVLVGKLAMVEIAGGGGYAFANASLHGPGLNPWNVNHWSGGSSSGAGSAVAAGLVPFALGSETWGSIITPATYCGLTALRPTWGLVSRYGAMELAWSMDKVGPMARSAQDCGWILQAIAGPDANDFTTGREFKFQPRVAKRDWHLGVLPADFSDEPKIEKAFNEALRILKKTGVKLTHIKLPEHPYAETARTILNAEMLTVHETFIKSKRVNGLVDKAQKKNLKKSLDLSAIAYARALKTRTQITRDVLALFKEYDALISPSLVIEAVPLEANLQTAFQKRGGYSVLGALCGLPALTMPMGFGKLNLPLGLNLTGNLFDENTLLQIGMIFQRETDWHRRRPPGN